MLSLISLSLYAAFNNGMKIWQRLNQRYGIEDLYIFLDRFTVDIQNACRLQGWRFQGKEDGFELPTLIDSPRLGRVTVGKATYSYNQQARTLSRSQADFSQLYESKRDNARLIGNIQSLVFEYYFFDKQKKEYFWLREYLGDNLPLAIRVELVYDDGKGKREFSKIVDIPVGG